MTSLAAGQTGQRALRVGFFSDAIPERNGVGTYYRDLSEHLATRIERAELFCPGQSDSRWDEPLRFALPGDATQTISVPNPRGLARRYAQLAPHAVVLATPGPYGLLGLRLARKHGARIVVGFHTHYEKLTDLYWKDRPGLGRVFRFYLESCNKILFRYGGKVLANSEEMVETARRLGAPAAELMGTTIPRAFIDTAVSELGETLGTVTFAGRLAAEKNLPAIIAAAEALPAIRFRIAGDGPERALVSAAAARLDNLEYLGWQPRERMLDIIDATDLLVLPSHVESFGTIALEAMARNRIVLVSAACGIAQWPALAPALFRIGEHESVATAIDRVASLDPAVRRQKAQAGREAARELNEWTLSHWLDVLGGAEPARAAHG